MRAQITAAQLAEVISHLLADPPGLTDEDDLDEACQVESFQLLMTDLAQVVCDYCGGTIPRAAELNRGIWCLQVQSNEAAPDLQQSVWGISQR